MDDLSEAELQVLHLLRGQDAKHFTLEIIAGGDQWHVWLEDHDSGKTGQGHGSDFATAWVDITPADQR